MKKKIDWNKVITKRNEQWNSASREEKKLIICEEVISMINTNQVIVEKGVYSRISSDTRQSTNKDNLQKEMLEGNIVCDACARGSMMLAKFRIDNPVWGNMKDGTNDHTTTALKEAFTQDELEKIESIFESNYETEDGKHYDDINNFTNEEWDNDEILERIKNFSNDPKEKLTQIMERIINCKGDVEKALSCTPADKIKFPVE